jgi:hypothetical protein
MDLLIPASGFATRMNGIPKFLLPVGISGLSILQTHVNDAEPFYENILIGVRSGVKNLIDETTLSPKVRVHELNTSTMTETVLQLVEKSSASRFSVVMPDTYFVGEKPHEKFSANKSDLMVGAWQIRSDQRGKLGQLEIVDNRIKTVVDKDPECEFNSAWGAMNFTLAFVEFLKGSFPHIGYGLDGYLSSELPHEIAFVDGDYFDCGTPGEYYRLIHKLDLF